MLRPVGNVQHTLKTSRDAVVAQSERSRLPAVVANVRNYSQQYAKQAADLSNREAEIDQRIADLHEKMEATRAQLDMLSNART